MNAADVSTNQLERRLDALRLRLHYVNRAWTLDDHEALLRFFVRTTPRLLDAERCAVFVVDRATGRVLSTVGTGLDGRPIEAPLEGSVVGRAISSGECVIENDLADVPGFHRIVDAQTGFTTRSLVCAPIRSPAGSDITGAVEVLNKRDGGHFDGDDGRLLQEVADYLAMALENVLVNREILQLSGELGREVSRLRSARAPSVPFVAESPAMRGVLELVRMVGDTPVGVLIQGENGTGKELIARMIHDGGDRAAGPFVAVNCAAVPETLVESEFFGYERGAFTGAATSRPGRFEEAERGTLFLDEVAEMPLAMQPKFLRAVQESEGVRLGANRPTRYDVRLVSATNRPLRKLVEGGAFREDLYYRLFAVEIVVPPLRERREDIVPLALAFLDAVSLRYGKRVAGFSTELLRLFEAYHWPGNVRQLRREVERLVALTPEGHHLTPAQCSQELVGAQVGASVAGSLDLPARVEALEIDLIRDALARSGGRRARAADLLGITRQGLHKKLRRYRLEDDAALAGDGERAPA
ncbi:MAG: sigma 54-interacting transcriptional regulator [Ectothiorhodospiraceae bacterium]|nr:sigma 54-interacting transcriptional regulator [Chromatiales bacterium]MCP5157553.1 sigma 54-interacting transcriptional regulator [Ectothiorhodospiraceae bacterium]